MTYYRTTVVEIGPEAGEMIEAGVPILFGEPLPEALAEVSIVHRPSQTLSGNAVSVGDVVSFAGTDLRIDAVGELADEEPRRPRPRRALHQPAEPEAAARSRARDRRHPRPKAGDVIEFRSSS